MQFNVNIIANMKKNFYKIGEASDGDKFNCIIIEIKLTCSIARNIGTIVV